MENGGGAGREGTRCCRGMDGELAMTVIAQFQCLFRSCFLFLFPGMHIIPAGALSRRSRAFPRSHRALPGAHRNVAEASDVDSGRHDRVLFLRDPGVLLGCCPTSVNFVLFGFILV